MENEASTTDEKHKEHIAFWEYRISDKDTDQLTAAVLRAVLSTASELLNNWAVLLPHVASVFLEAYKSNVTSQDPICLKVGKGTIDFSSH